MKRVLEFLTKNKVNILIGIIFLIGFSVRIIGITDHPNGLNCDEASIGYEAYSVLNYGIDRNGNSWPVFLEAWGSGQNALYMYIIMPFVKIFGLTVLAVRLPMAIIGCISLVVMYKLLKKTQNQKIAIIGLAFFAICPWHIMKSRYGLESNIFPDMILWGVYLFIKGIADNKTRWIYISSVIFGLSAYAYGTAYYFLPVFLIVLLIIFTKNKKLNLKQDICILLIVFMISLPIILMIFINTFDLKQLNIGHFTIPRLEENRYEQLTILSSKNIIKTLAQNLKNAVLIILLQYDGFCSNALKFYGIIYFFATPIAIFGIIKCRKQNDDVNIIFKVWLIVSLVLMFICEPNIVRMNIIYMPLIYYTIIGIEKINHKSKLFGYFLTIIFLYSFITFQIDYYKTDFTNTFTFVKDVENVIKYSKNIKADKIYFEYSFKEPYIYILFYNQVNPEEFVKTVEYEHGIKDFDSVIAFSNYVFEMPDKLNENKNNAYIMTKNMENKYNINLNIWSKTYIDNFVVIQKR